MTVGPWSPTVKDPVAFTASVSPPAQGPAGGSVAAGTPSGLSGPAVGEVLGVHGVEELAELAQLGVTVRGP
ncbi:MAG: hypothetical protein MOP51_2967 [Citricoccus sp.]|jgi:hypothetical protein|nr:hypothetical protein [Citricoccus sp. WCRC_4]